MKKRSLVLTLAASAALVLGARVFVFPDRATPSEHLEELRARSQATGVDPALLVREITRILQDPRTAEDAETHAALLWLRAEVQAQSRHYPAARADLEQHAVVLGEATPAAVLRTAELEALEGRTQDARTRVQRLLESNADLHAGWRLAGRLERRLAHETREAALETANVLLVRASLERALEILVELCARDPEDTRRLPLASELADLYLPSYSDELARAIDLASTAAGYHAAARASLTRSLAGGPDGASVAALIDLLREAGQPELAVDLGATIYPEGSEPAEVFQTLIEAMLEAGQIDRFAERVRTFPWRPIDASPELCIRVLEALYTSGAWNEARTRVSSSGPLRCLRVLNRPDTESALYFYQGLSSYATASAAEDENRSRVLHEKAITSLERFIVSSSRIDPFPGAGAVAHLFRSRSWRALGDERREREDLGRALTPSLDVDGDEWLSHVTGRDFLRHAELVLELPQRGSRRPEEDWTQGMARLPGEAYDLVGRWEEIGQASLDETGHDIQRLFTNMRGAGSVAPAMDVGPWTRWKLARMLIERGNLQGAVVAARRLMESFPGLVLAHDLLIESQLGRGSRIQVVEDILTRLEITGPDERHTQYVAQVGLSSFGPTQLLRVMQLDPEGVGLSVVAPRMMSAGDPARALRAIGPVKEGEASTTRLLRARALEQLGRTAKAEALFASLLSDPEYAEAALEALVRFSLANSEDESLGVLSDVLMQRLAEDELPRTDLALVLIDREIERGNAELARALLEQLDARAVTRSGELLWRIGIDRLLSGQHEEALEAFDRAEAFLEDERVAVAELVLAIEDREWRSLGPRVRALRRSGYEPTPLVDAILTLLQERPEAGQELAAAGLVAEPRSAEWLLVRAAARTLLDEPFPVPAYFDREGIDATRRILVGTEHVLRDPREVLGILLLLELPNTDAWIRDALQRLDPTAEEVWTGYFRARLATRGQRWPVAEYQWRQLVREHRRFGPGWAGLLETVEAITSDPWDEAVLKARVDRRNSLRGTAGGSDLDLAIDKAAIDLMKGDREAAIEDLAPAVAGTKARAADARVLLGRLYAGLGRYADADRTISALLADARPGADGYWLDEYVRWLVEGSRSTIEEEQRLGLRKVLSRLEVLQERFPNDPLLPLEHARVSLKQVANPAQAVGLTLRELEAFKDRTRDVAFERLRPGSSRAWGRFLLGFSPREAEVFLLDQLSGAPGQIDLWSLLAQSLSAQGRSADARDLLRSVVQMSHDPLAIHAYAWELVASGASPSIVNAVLDGIPEAEDPYGPERGRFLRAIAELRGARASLEVAEQILAPLWEARGQLRGVNLQLLGRSYASVLLRRGSKEDLEAIGGVLRGLDRLPQGPYVRMVLDAFRGVATFRHSPEGQRRVQSDRATEKNSPRNQRREPQPREAAGDGEATQPPAKRRNQDRPRRERNDRRREDAAEDAAGEGAPRGARNQAGGSAGPADAGAEPRRRKREPGPPQNADGSGDGEEEAVDAPPDPLEGAADEATEQGGELLEERSTDPGDDGPE